MHQATTAGFHLSPQQKRLWNELGDGPAPFVHMEVLLEGPLDSARLQAAIGKTVARHEILRTTFPRNPQFRMPFQVVDSGSILQTELAALREDRHSLTIGLPALCADAITLKNLVEEIARHYAGAGDDLADPMQYADYSEWHNDLLQKCDAEAVSAREYWAAHDYSGVAALALPFAGQRGSARETVAIAVNGAGSPDVFLAAWQLLLGRMTGRQEIVVGRVAGGRNHDELAQALGSFARVVPAYANFEGEISFAEAVKRGEAARGEAVAFEDYRSDDEAYVAGFSVEERAAADMGNGLTCTVVEQRGYAFPFAVEMRCIAERGVWRAELVSDPGYYRTELAETLARGLAVLLAAAIENPETPCEALPAMDARERDRILNGFNATGVEWPDGKNIVRLFEEQAERTPGRAAIRCGGDSLTYSELNARANRLAGLLHSRGVKANAPVALFVERSAETITGLLGILKAGGCYVPLAPGHPKARLANQLAECGSPVVLTQTKLAGGLPDTADEVICLDGPQDIFERHSERNLSGEAAAGDLAYVIYTSGSTGAPKGVAVRHGGVANYARAISRLLRLDEAEEGLQFATVSTLAADLGNTCIFPALISGGCLHVVESGTAMDPGAFAAYTEDQGIDVLKITPSHLSALMQGAGGDVLPRKVLFCGGEALSWELLGRIQQAGACAVINHYGPTEATVGCCVFPAGGEAAWGAGTVPIGKPLANDRVYILDRLLQPVPVGVAGELCVGGAGLASGYLNQPQQTAEKFIPDPFSGDASEHIYRTGDLARFLPDGSIEFLGRADEQVKIRGFRVEPAEIEAALKRHPSVRQAVAVPFESPGGEKQIAAYLVSEKLPSSDELRRFLLQHLPDYMMPSAFVAVPAIPLTTNGKLDRKALPKPEAERTEADLSNVAPKNATEEKLLAIWKEVMKLDHIGATADFFQLGGHSLMAIQVISRIRAEFGVQVALHDFLAAPTIANVALKIAEAPAVESEEEAMLRLLQELDEISEEEAEALLAKKAD